MAPHPSTPEQILEVIAEAMPTLRQMGALRLGIFGSRVHGVARIDSDVDVLVTLAPGRDLLDLVAIRDQLQEILGLPVDVVTESGIRDDSRESILRDVRYAA